MNMLRGKPVRRTISRLVSVQRVINLLPKTLTQLPANPQTGKELAPAGGAMPQVYSARKAIEDRRQAVRTRMLFAAVFVALVGLCATAYCYLLSSPMYVATSRFAIRGQAEAGGNALFGKNASALSNNPLAQIADGFAARDYLLSAGALEELDRSAGFVRRMRERGDFYLNLRDGVSKEALLGFYHRVVKVRFNMTEGIVSVDVHAYTPEDALALAAGVNTIAGEFANNLNRQATAETLRAAREELARAEKRLANSRSALNAWRRENASLDVEANAKMIHTIIEKLEAQLSEARAELRQIIQNGLSDTPRKRFVEDRIATLSLRITNENARLTSSRGENSVVDQLGDYQRLLLEQEFASKIYETTLQSMTHAQAVANIQQKFLAVIVNPTMPDEAVWPSPVRVIPLAMIIAALAWFLLALAYSVIVDNARS